MKLPIREMLLRILASASIGIWLYSAAATLRTGIFADSGGLFAILLFAADMFLGHLTGRLLLGKPPAFVSRIANLRFIRFSSFMLHIRDASRSTAVAFALGTALLPVFFTLLSYQSHGMWRILFEILITMIAFTVSLSHSKKSFSEIFSNTAIYSGFFVFIVCLEVPYFINRLGHLRPWLFAGSYFFILTYLIIKNQEDIDQNIFHKKHVEKSMLPKNLRKFNTLSVFFIFLLILLISNFKTVVMYFLGLLGKLALLITKGILWVMGLLFSSDEIIQPSGSPKPDDNIFMMEGNATHPFWDLLVNILKYVVLIYILYRIVLLAAKWIPLIAGKVIRWIKKLFSGKIGDSQDEITDYCDETEVLRPTRIRSSRRNVKRHAKRSRRDLRKISDPVEKVRYIYSSILRLLPDIGVKPEKSETTLELLKKTAFLSEINKELSPVTDIYNQVRYGEVIPDTGVLDKAEEHFSKAVRELEKR